MVFPAFWYAGRDLLPTCFQHMVRRHRRPAGDAQQPTGLLQQIFESLSLHMQKTRYPNGYLVFWYAGRDSNPQPSEPESDALSIEPPAHLLHSQAIIAVFLAFVKGAEKNIFCILMGLHRESGCFLRFSVV